MLAQVFHHGTNADGCSCGEMSTIQTIRESTFHVAVNVVLIRWDSKVALIFNPSTTLNRANEWLEKIGHQKQCPLLSHRK
jgi:hypothetical protein